MTIYPYVYKLLCPTTGHFYYGARWANKLPALEDPYMGSGKHYLFKELKFEKEIIAEFFDSASAQEYESELIKEHISNPLCINIMVIPHYTSLNKEPWNKGKKGVQPKQSKETLLKRFSDDARRKMSESRKGKPSWNKGKTDYKPSVPRCSCIICKKEHPINTTTLHYTAKHPI